MVKTFSFARNTAVHHKR